MKPGKLLTAVAVILAGSAVMMGQTDPNFDQGLKPYGSYHGGDLDSVGLANGNLTVHIPLISYPQRGRLQFGFALVYNGKGWIPHDTGTHLPNGTEVFVWQYRGSGVQPVRTPSYLGTRQVFKDNQGNTQFLAYTAASPDGGGHPLGQTGNQTWESLDGTGLRTTGVASGIVTDGSGVTYNMGCTGGLSVDTQDSNGNQILLNNNGTCLNPGATWTWMDSMGRQIQVPKATQWTGQGNVAGNATDTGGCPGGTSSATLWSLPGYSGGSYPLKFCYSSYSLSTHFGVSWVNEGSSAATLLTAVILPNSTMWQFAYDGYGDLTSVTLPTGGTITYGYATLYPGSQAAPATRAVISRTVNSNDGSGAHTWNYQYIYTLGAVSRTIVTSPPVANDTTGSDTVHDFNTTLGREVTERRYQGPFNNGNGVLLKTVNTQYHSDTTNAVEALPSGVVNVVPTSVTTVWPSGKQRQTTYSYDSGAQFYDYDYFNTINTNYTPLIYGSVLTQTESDYGSGVSGPVIKTTTTAYKWQADASYLAANLLSLPSSVVVQDGAGNKCAETDYIYDEATYLTTPTPVITAQHVTPLGVRGNPTTAKHKLSSTPCAASSTWTDVISHTNWYDTGTVFQSIDPLGHTTTNSYGTGFNSRTDFLGAYVTKTQNALLQSADVDYDFNTGLGTAARDANGNVASSDYDTEFRILHHHAPDGGLVTWSYNDSVPPVVTVTTAIAASLNHVAEGDVDGLGRLAHSKLLSDPEGVDTTDITYDVVGRTATTSNPHRSSTSSTDGVTTLLYDALGRVTQTIPADGALSSNNLSCTNCVVTDYSQFPLVTVTDQQGKQRQSITDGLGRLIEVHEPGGAGVPAVATGSVSVAGNLQSTQLPGTAATSGVGSVSISGQENSFVDPTSCEYDSHGNPIHCTTIWDTGTLTITVNGFGKSVTYGASSTPASLASSLASAFNADGASPVSASSSGPTVYLTAKAAGSGTNYALSASSSTNDPVDFGSTSFPVSAPSSLSGGQNAVPGPTVYDLGSAWVTVQNFTASVNYGQSSNSTATLVASALAQVFNSNASSPVTATANGSTLTLTSKVVGVVGNSFAVTTGSSTGQPQYFSSPSFTESTSGMSGGADGATLGTPAITKYFYDPLSNLIRVEQWGTASSCDANCRVRTFVYDSLSRLVRASNPESGTINYVYDLEGNLIQKISPQANQTGSATTAISYCYDKLHRLTDKSYTPQPPVIGQPCTLQGVVVHQTYDQGTNGIGNLTATTDQAGSGSYTYDVMGRIAGEARTINPGAGMTAVSKTVSYEYNLDGSLFKLHYPSGAIVTYTPSAAGRMLSAVDQAGSINYVTGATYTPSGALTGMTNGSASGFSGIVTSNQYNSRLQPVNLTANAPSGSLLTLSYNFAFGYANNGNVMGITNNRDTSRNQTFTYDALNRLISAQNAGTDCSVVVGGKTKSWGNNYAYDAWGNLLSKSVTKCSSENLSVTALANNQLSGYGYDAAGNMTHDATSGLNYSYDAENRITGANGFTYTYDDDGNRVEKSNGWAGTLYWYMSPGIVAESDLSGNLQSEYVFFDGERVARRDGPTGAGGIFYYFSDHLKTASVITDAAGNIKAESDYYPWGGELQFTNSDSNHYKFTGKERDGESGLDYFGARYYSNGLGRFITPDPILTTLRSENPQTLNRYTYTLNNPLRYIDPNGLYEEDVHRDLTIVLAMAAGFSETTANAIGAGDQGVDDDSKTGPFAGEEARRNYHFTTEERRNDLYNAFEVSGSATDLGIYLHAEQDSYSHAGFGPKFGHLSAGHAPDKTYNDPGKADTMAKDTYNVLVFAATNLGVNNTRVAWEKIDKLVGDFNKAKTKEEKQKILGQIRDVIREARTKRKKQKYKTLGPSGGCCGAPTGDSATIDLHHD